MQIEILGHDTRLPFAKGELLLCPPKEDFGINRLSLLPVPSSRDGVHISGADTELKTLIPLANEGTLVAGYALAPSFVSELKSRGARVIDVSESEEFLLENARLTAEATLGIILLDYQLSPRDMKIGIIGYGRIGRELLTLLRFFGAELTLYTRRRETLKELSSLGVKALLLSPDENFTIHDLVINTSPAPLSGNFFDTEVLELASGDNFPVGVRVKKLPSLPAIYYPKSSGKLYAKYILRSLY